MKKLPIAVGQRYGKLVIERIFSEPSCGRKCECICDCGEKNVVDPSPLYRGRVKSCGCGLKKSQFKWAGYQDLSGTYWGRLKHNAKLRGHKFDLSIEQAWDLLVKQKHRCALSGREIALNKSYLRKNVPEWQTASLDRIDSTKGYTIDNVQWVDVSVNYMKMDMTQFQFIELCKEIAKHASRKRRISGR